MPGSQGEASQETARHNGSLGWSEIVGFPSFSPKYTHVFVLCTENILSSNQLHLSRFHEFSDICPSSNHHLPSLHLSLTINISPSPKHHHRLISSP